MDKKKEKTVTVPSFINQRWNILWMESFFHIFCLTNSAQDKTGSRLKRTDLPNKKVGIKQDQ
jgi:hypothetical protein